MVDRFLAAPPWTNEYGWISLIESCFLVNSLSDIDIFDLVSSYSDANSSIDDMSKIFILHRVIFSCDWIALPKNRFFGGWVGVPIKDGFVDVSWPIKFDANSQVHIGSKFMGYYGDVYDAVGEFTWLKNTFERRPQH